MWLIAGLGNPGPKYETTRHNFGFLVLDALIDKYQVNLQKFPHGMMGKHGSAVFLKPSTFMNRSGQAVLSALTFYKINKENLIVLHDDIDLPLGDLRLKKDGGHGGHNGLRDIIRLLGPDFIRVRLGVGRPAHKGAEADFVLQNFTDQELLTVEQVIDKSITAIETIVDKNLLEAQNFCQIKIK